MMPGVERDLIRTAGSAYFIGIGGVGMSALARVLKHHGLRVSGSDLRASARTRELEACGIPVRTSGVNSSFEEDFIVYSSAIREGHAELAAARASGKPVYHRAQVLAALLNHGGTSVAVTGSHGKTTTSSMTAYVLSALKRNPTCLLGGDLINVGSNVLLGNSDLWVSEVDESDRTHELYTPNYAIITNLDEDHHEHYRDYDAVVRSFEKFLENPKNPGLVVYWEDDPELRRIVTASRCPRVSFGFSPTADFSASGIEHEVTGVSFDLLESGFFAARIRLGVPGKHNVANALAVIALLVSMGCDLEEIREALPGFRGARRRLEIIAASDALTVVNDYAHHPTEIRASMGALRTRAKALTVIFQPHRFSRTRRFFREFGQSFQDADELILTDIYGADEPDAGSVDIQRVYEAAVASGHPRVRVMEKQKIIDYLINRPVQNGIVAFMGAGDIGELADEFARRFKSIPAT